MPDLWVYKWNELTVTDKSLFWFFGEKNWQSMFLADVCRLEAWRNSSNSHKHDISCLTLWWLASMLSSSLVPGLLADHSFYKSLIICHNELQNDFLHPFFFFPVLSVDAIDMSGKHEVDLDTNIWKVRQHLSYKNFIS